MERVLDLELAISEFLSLEGVLNIASNRYRLISVWNTIRKFGYHDRMSEKEFIDTSILIASKLTPEHYRKGQSVFIYIDEFLNCQGTFNLIVILIASMMIHR